MDWRVLILEKDETYARELQQFFRHRGEAVDRATDLDHARSLLDARPYSLVISDLRLGAVPSANDVAALARRTSPGVRVVLLSEAGCAPLERAARTRAIDAFLHKPVPLHALDSLVDYLFREAS